ncbi:mycothione reductase [Micrococcus cohnii]|uniref:Mycothione reductase n=1 Tax=Micrococcus cohnii TaxID=993416 RepID=A0A7W7M3A6_9MICC|nr:mycothione reductase [Micrococcus cohnii]MBB4735452.1 mycothione reductase [Micrococcus cohnii]
MTEQNSDTAHTSDRGVEQFDLIIVGSGSGNSLIGEQWADRRVAIVDDGVFGGTCLNRGCIPTKMYAYPASLAAASADAARVDVQLPAGRVDFAALRDRVFGRVDAISEAGLRFRRDEQEHVTVVAERARFTGLRELVTDSGRRLRGAQVVVAAGSRPTLPELPGLAGPRVHTSDTIMRLEELPERLVVMGGGFVGAEFASVFSAFGTQVTQVVRGARLLSAHDETVARTFTRIAAEQWDLRLETQVAGVEDTDDAARVRLSDGSTIDADLVLVATGRTPNVDRIDAAAAGFDVTEDGVLAVDRFQRVLADGEPVPGVWALGDIANTWQLKHVANYEARVVAHNLENPERLRAADLDPVPAAVFTRPQIAAAGLTEAQAVARLGADRVTVKEQGFGDVAYGWAMEDTEGICKLVADRETGRLLGAHLIGPDAANLIQPLVQAMSFGLDAHTMARGQYWIHPALSEVVENALLGLDVPAPL